MQNFKVCETKLTIDAFFSSIGHMIEWTTGKRKNGEAACFTGNNCTSGQKILLANPIPNAVDYTLQMSS